MSNSHAIPKSAFLALILLGTGLLSACGGGGEGTAAAAGTDPTSGQATGGTSDAGSTSTTGSLTISGTPTTSIAANRSYSFTPTANATSGVSFSIASKPAWATFSTVTGALTGTPTAVGKSSNIVISVSNGTASAALPAFAIDVTQATANVGAATLSWNPPTENTDGSTVSNLGGYNIYYGANADSLTTKIQVTNPGLTAYTISNLGSGTYVFGISAYTTSGAESAVYVVGSKTIS